MEPVICNYVDDRFLERNMDMLQFYLQIIETEEDRTKFEFMYNKYRQTMYAVAFKVLKHKQDSEDAVHTAFLRIAEVIEKVDVSVEQKIKCFVVTVVYHIAIDIYNQKKRRWEQECPLDNVSLSISFNVDNTLAKCIAQLEPKYRTALILKYEYGYTLKELAIIMNISESNAKNYTFRARQKVVELYEKEDV